MHTMWTISRPNCFESLADAGWRLISEVREILKFTAKGYANLWTTRCVAADAMIIGTIGPWWEKTMSQNCTTLLCVFVVLIQPPHHDYESINGLSNLLRQIHRCFLGTSL